MWGEWESVWVWVSGRWRVCKWEEWNVVGVCARECVSEREWGGQETK